MHFNVYLRVPGYRGKYRKVCRCESQQEMIQKVDKLLFIDKERPEDILVREPCFELDEIGDGFYGWD